MTPDQRSSLPATPTPRDPEIEQPIAERAAALLEANRILEERLQQLAARERALSVSEHQFRIMFEQSAAGIAQVGLDGRFLNVNQRLCDMLQYPVEDLLRMRFFELTHPDHLAQDSAAYEELLAGRQSTYRTEKRYLRRDGSIIWTNLTVSIVREPDGEPQYFVSVIEDISQRRHIQDDLRRSQQQLQSILDHTTAVVYVKDEDGRYELINRQYEELFHISRSEIVGRTDLEIFPLETAEKLRANDVMVLKSGHPVELEEIVPHDDGPHTYISIKVPIIDADGRAVALCGISTDISERKRAEGLLRQAKESAEQANLAKSRFLANVSHEIRTPIMALLTAAEIIRGGGLSSDDLEEHGEVILRNGRHLLALVDDLLNQSRVDAGRLDVVRASCCVAEIMADVHAVTSPLMSLKPVDFQIVFETAIPELITTDRTRLTQAVVNLVQNALKFTSEGNVFVRVRFLELEGSPHLSVSVEDTGRGIEPGDCERIFEPFVQVGPADQSALTGVGLGLSVSRSIAEQLGGSLSVGSQVGQGSVFTLLIPVGPLDSTHWIAPEDASHWHRRHRLQKQYTPRQLCGEALLAEDAHDVRRMLTRALENTGVKVTTVGDGLPAVEAARQKHFDLILLDIRMPEMDGFAAAQAIRALGYTGPLIALTASTTKSEHDRILGAGFDDLWAKPLSLHKFIELASAYLGGPSGPAPQLHPLDPRRFQDVRDEFLQGLNSRMARLQAALMGGDQNAVGDVLHQLSGSGGIMGFMELSRQARLVEAEFKAGRLSVTSPEYIRLVEITNEISNS